MYHRSALADGRLLPWRLAESAHSERGSIMARAFVTSEAKDGKDAGELAGIGPIGIAATTSPADVLGLDADVVNYAPLYAELEQMAQILSSGKNIVTPIGFVYPEALDPADIAILADACLAGGTSL